jgi:hypothetical protein
VGFIMENNRGRGEVNTVGNAPEPHLAVTERNDEGERTRVDAPFMPLVGSQSGPIFSKRRAMIVQANLPRVDFLRRKAIGPKASF